MSQTQRIVFAVTGVLVAGILIAPPAPAGGPDGGVLQPGMQVGGCTLGFALEAPDGTAYFAWAAHCANVGTEVSGGGVADFGRVVYHDDWDFSLVRVYDQYTDLVSGAVKGHPGVPTGMTDPYEENIGDLLQFSGYGLGYGLFPVTQENRVGVVTPGGSGNEYCSDAMIHWGDSGGPVIHAPTGEALGIVSRLATNCFPTASLTGPNIVGGLDRARSAGFDLTIKTA